MTLRVSTASTYARFVRDIHANLRRLVAGQEQAGSGLRINRPSDDPIGAARMLSLQSRLEENARVAGAIQARLPYLESASSTLQDASSALGKAHALIVQGLGGSLSLEDRAGVADELDSLRLQMLEFANAKFADQYLFGGTNSSAQPFAEVTVGGQTKVVYQGDDHQLKLQLGSGAPVATNVPGSAVFSASDPAGAAVAGVTGAAVGTTANQGTGTETLIVQHTATDPGALGTVGVALVGGGAGDTLLGDNALVIDDVAGTIQLGSGPVLALPDPASPEALDFVVENELGGELHLDLSGWSGAPLTTTVRGDGEVSLDGSTFVPVTFTETDLQLTNPATGAVLHVDTTGLKAAGEDLVSYQGTVNVFDTLQSVADALRDPDLSQEGLQDTVELLFSELERNQDELLGGLSLIGSRTNRLQSTDQRLQDVDVQVQSLLSEVRDVDYAEVITEIAKAEQTLAMVEATGVRILQSSLLNYL